jgi:hypothetical protein
MARLQACFDLDLGFRQSGVRAKKSRERVEHLASPVGMQHPHYIAERDGVARRKTEKLRESWRHVDARRSDVRTEHRKLRYLRNGLRGKRPGHGGGVHQRVFVMVHSCRWYSAAAQAPKSKALSRD